MLSLLLVGQLSLNMPASSSNCGATEGGKIGKVGYCLSSGIGWSADVMTVSQARRG